jgi:hypothetical protein
VAGQTDEASAAEAVPAELELQPAADVAAATVPPTTSKSHPAQTARDARTTIPFTSGGHHISLPRRNDKPFFRRFDLGAASA